MGLQYVVTKRVFGFDKTKTEKYVAKSVGSGELDFDKLCAKVSRIIGIHRKIVDLVAVGLVDIMSEEIDDGKTVVLGDFGRFRPTFSGKASDTEEEVSADNIVRKRILFYPGKAFNRMLEDMSITKMVMPDVDYTDGSSLKPAGSGSGNDGGGSGQPDNGDGSGTTGGEEGGGGDDSSMD